MDQYTKNQSYQNHVPIATATVSSMDVNSFPVYASSDVSAAPTTLSKTASSIASGCNDARAREYLTAHQWPVGLQDTLINGFRKVPLRFIICDNSGSMIENDGHILFTHKDQKRLVQCSRWIELTESLKFHAGLAKAACSPTEFRLLNGSAPIRIGLTDNGEEFRMQELQQILSGSPGGGTPLCRHIREVIEQIRLIEPQLRAAGQKVCVVIATDGESNDGDVAQAMQPLRQLPVWVVIRLCTDEDHIVEYWNNIDSQLELEMDVLDDLCGEAMEVYQNNPWLTYGEPLHRLREFGITIKEIDLLDETKLTKDQIRRFCAMLFGGTIDSYPHPAVDWKSFYDMILNQNQQLSKIWDPKTKKMKAWIKLDKLNNRYGDGLCLLS